MLLDLPMRRTTRPADERVEEDRDKVALERGPLVYAPKGPTTAAGSWTPSAGRRPRRRAQRPDLLGGVTVLTGNVRDTQGRARQLTAIPYYAWSH